MDESKRKDIEYRIANLDEAAIQILYLPETGDDWGSGYRCGRLRQIESEIRFLKGLVRS
jgi:hypothetical protein